MDFVLPEKEYKQKRNLRLLRWAALPVVLAALVFLLRALIQPGIDYRSLRTSPVELKPIAAAITASGQLVPEFEQMISSPLAARIDSVYFPIGSKVKAGSPILQLDLSSAQLELDKLDELIQKKRNEAEILRLRLEKNLADLQASYDIKTLQIQSLEAALGSEKELVAAGGGTHQQVDQAALNLQIAKRELSQLQAQIRNQKESNAADLTSLQFELRIEEKNRADLKDRMQQAQIQAPRDGVLVYINDQLGATVAAGQEIVRLADLSRFKVRARLSDAYAHAVSLGGRARVRLGNESLPATIRAIEPEVRDNQLSFELSLDEPGAEGLRPNLQVEVLVITQEKAETTVVRNGPFYKGKSAQKVFVVDGNEAIARTVDIGLTNLDSVEVIGLQAGEELIISDMSEYAETDIIALENHE